MPLTLLCLFQKAKLNLQKDKPELMHFIKQHWSLQDREQESLKCAFTISRKKSYNCTDKINIYLK